MALLLVGCYTKPTLTDDKRGSPSRKPSESKTQWISASELVLDVTVEPAVIEPGGTLHIRLTVTNPRDAAVWTGFADGCVYGFTVRNGSGEIVAPPPRFCPQKPEEVTFAPREVVVLEFPWTWDDSKIEPGTYSVFAGFGVRAEGGPVVNVQLKQNPTDRGVAP
jgi:hypothetical protein